MRRRRSCVRTLVVLGAAIAALAVPTASASAAALPAPCGGDAQVIDVVGDGHHDGTDVVRGWFSEASGHLQVVMTMQSNLWQPQHDDGAGAGYVLLFSAGGTTRYVRAFAPVPAGSALRYDWGTWTASTDPATGYHPLGTTTGSTIAGYGGGVTIDVPTDAMGLAPGTVLGAPFVLTYDGEHYVDHGPGGPEPDDTARGADFVLGSCSGAATPGGGAAGAGGVATTTTGVTIAAVDHVVGARRVTVRVGVQPARAGVAVVLQQSWHHGLRRSTARTGADGTVAFRAAVGETSRLKATVDGLASRTATIEVRSAVRVRLARAADGSTLLRGTTATALPGSLLVLDVYGIAPVASRAIRGGSSFAVRLRHLPPGRYQVVFVPASERAERSTSNTVRVR